MPAQDPPPSGWTLHTLLVHVDARIEAVLALTEQRFRDTDKAVQAALVAQEKAVAAALAAASLAVAKAETANEKRADAANEFRGQLSDQAATLMPRAEAEQRVATLADKIGEMSARLDKTEGKSTGFQAGWGILVAAISVVGVLVAVYLGIR